METHLEKLRSQIREMASGEIAPHVQRGETELIFPDEVRVAMARAGCFARSLPVEYGGEGDGLRAFSVQQEELGRVWPTAAVAATWANLSGRLIHRFGSKDQRDELLPGLADGTGLGAVGFTEPHGGSDAAGIRSHAKEDGDGWILNGSKRMVDNSDHAKFLVVTARTDGEPRQRKGISMFVVRPEDEGFNVDQIYRTLGLRACGVGRFSFNECRLPGERLLGTRGQGFYQMMDMVEFGRIGVAAICIGMVEAALASTVGYLRERVVFGAPLSENAALIATVADIRTRLDAARLLTEHGAALVDEGVRCQKESAEAKVFASDLCVEATSTLLRLHGGIAYTEETNLEMLVRDSHCFVIGEGTSDVLRMIIGRHEMGRA